LLSEKAYDASTFIRRRPVFHLTVRNRQQPNAGSGAGAVLYLLK
jgi:hypothetical protein